MNQEEVARLQAYLRKTFGTPSLEVRLRPKKKDSAEVFVNGEFIGRNTGIGNDFFSLSLRINRAFAVGRGVRLEGQLEAFNLTNRVNNVTLQSNFGAGAYPTNPSPNFGQVTAVGDPRSLQFGIRLRF